jgi:hypothetical protein
MIDHSCKEKIMKKTSLMLAISALLYGTFGTYALAELTLSPEMSPEEVSAFLDTINIPEPTGGMSENAPDLGGLASPTGLNLEALPKNIAVDSSNAVHVPKMCPESFAVNGHEMAKFPVTVTFGDGTKETQLWTAGTGTKGYASGTGWLLAQKDDTWNHQWTLSTNTGVSIKQIVFEPLKRNTSGDNTGEKRVYTFDVGGKLPRAPLPDNVPIITYEHTPGSARGQVIKQTIPAPSSPIFTATYSDPVYTVAHDADPKTNNWSLDGNSIPLNEAPKASNNFRKPIHDLYGKLTIDFPTPVGGNTPINVVDFAYVADTDCILPVNQVNLASYEDGILKFTVVGEGAVAIMENGQKVVQGPFVVERGDGEGTFTTQFTPKAGSCYNMTDVDTLKVMTPDYCF